MKDDCWVFFFFFLIAILKTLNMHHKADSVNDFMKAIYVDFLLPQEKETETETRGRRDGSKNR